MKKRRLKKSGIAILVCVAILFCSLIGWGIHRFSSSKEEVVVEETPTPIPSVEPTKDPRNLFDDAIAEEKYHLLLEDMEINPEVVAYLFFNSGMVEEPVLQSIDNEKYLTKNWEDLSYRSYGSAFMDFRNDLTMDDQNIIIYGHYIYEYRNPDRTLMFTPLALLRDENNLKDNQDLVLITPEEIRYYQIAYVYDCPLEKTEYGDVARDDLQFNIIDYEEDYFEVYRNAISTVELYEIGNPLEYEDDFLTLQTCIENHEESRQVIHCKEIERREIPEEWKE